MRKSTRLRFFLATVSLSAFAGIFAAACGDDDSGGGGTGAPDSSIPETSKPDTAASDTGLPDTGPKDAAPDGPIYNAGDATVLEAGPEYEGGIACVVGGQIEEEVNDDPDAANELRVSPEAGCVGTGCSRCGVIFDNDLDAGKDAGDGGLGGTELEYVSFVLHPATKNFYIQYAGDVTLVVTVEGSATEYVISSTSAPTLPYTAGKRYFVAVKSNTGVLTPWRVTLFENQ
jgi:hypothetical protein